MWIGTKNGLNRYDGHSFKIFRPGAGNSISNEVINDIAEDRDGNIWVATMEGLNYYDLVKDHWECLVPDPGDSRNGIPNYIVWDIRFDADDQLWIASDVFEFTRYDRRTKKFTYYDWPGFARRDPNFGKGYNSILRITPKNDHEFWLGTTKGLVSLDIHTKEFRFIGGGYNSDVYCLKYDAGGKKVFLSAEKGELFMYDEETNRYSSLVVQPEPYPSSHFSIPGTHELWLASEKGLIKVSDDRENFYLADHIPGLSGSLLPGGVRSIFEDNTGLRWVGTSNGIALYDPARTISSFLPLLPVSDKEGNNKMAGAWFDAISNTYFVCSMDPASVFLIDAFTGNIKKINTDATGKLLSACHVIKTDRKSNIWLLTDNNVYRYDRSTGKFILFPMPNNGEKIGFRDFIEDAEGNYWFGTFHRRFYYYQVKEKKFVDLPDSNFKYARIVTSLCSDTINKAVWLGTFSEGIFRYDLTSKKLTGYFQSDKNPEYATLNLVHDIITDNHNRIWIATHSGGIFRYNEGMPPEKAFTRFDMKKGLSNNNYVSLCAGRDSVLWLLSGKGISAMSTSGKFLYDVPEEQVFNFSSWSSDNNLSHSIVFNNLHNELLVPVGGGLLFYSPHSKQDSLSFAVILTNIKVEGREVTTDDNSIQHEIPFRFNTVSFEFAGLYYGSSPDITYEYRLQGYDNNWLPAGNSYTVAYQNLPPGNYLFHVRAKDKRGTIVGEVSGFSFRIFPPFWQTGVFIALIIAIVVGGIYWFIHSLRQKLKAEKQLSSFATSLYGQNTVDDILWDTAKNCIEKIGFADCVIYELEEGRNVLIQRAAYGPKNPYRREILNRIEIPVGKGIVGTVAKTGKAEIIRNTTKDPRYIVDDEKRLSEITVPVMVDGKVFAVIDSEHPKRNFFRRHHVRLLTKVAGICSERISKYLNEEKLRSKIARDLHDEMGSTLTSINIISKVAMQGVEEEKIKTYLQKIKDNSGRMMESMSDIVWAINPANDSFEKVIVRMKEFAAEILEPARINYYFSEEGSLDKAQLNLEQRKDIYMIFKEAINNTVKYSGATEVNIVLQKRDDNLRMVIIDNGNGFDPDHLYSGNGLKNMQVRSKEMNAKLRVDSIKGTGTTIILEVAIT